MTTSLGLDIGSNSVGSAWVDTDRKEITLGITVFPAGVEESERGRGAPKNQHRRGKRGQRKTTSRRADRKRHLRRRLSKTPLLPTHPEEQREIFGPRRKGETFNLNKWNPWRLRREAITRELQPYEFGRVLIHLNQRRGSAEIKVNQPAQKVATDTEETKPEDEKEKNQKKEKRKATAAAKRTANQLEGKTFGQWVADEFDRRRLCSINRRKKHFKFYRNEIRNRRDKLLEANGQSVLANREMIRQEFEAIWKHQLSYDGELARFLKSDDGCKLRAELLDPHLDAMDKRRRKAWREGGIIFGQRKTFWNVKTLGRCDLDPTDRCVPEADMYAQRYRVVETVNNIRIKKVGEDWRSLHQSQRDNLIEYLSTPQFKTSKKSGKAEKKSSATVPDVKKQLGIDKETLAKEGAAADSVESSLDKIEDREITNWFSREVIHGVFGKSNWNERGDIHERVNRELLRLDPESDEHAQKLKRKANKRWGLSEEASDRLIRVWRDRPKLKNRLNMSRRAIRNILPYMQHAFTHKQREPHDLEVFWLSETAFDPVHHRWLTQIDAKQAFAEDPHAVDRSSQKPATPEQRIRYAHTVTDRLRKVILEQVGGDENELKRLLRLRGRLRKADRHYLEKHPEQRLPPAPQLSNPVVRKAIHVVRQHIIKHLKKHANATTDRPDQIVIELAREIRQSGKVRDAVYRRNENRNKIRKDIADKWQQYTNGDPRHVAVDRVLLCRQQNFTCPYSGLPKGKLKPAEEGHCVYSGKTISEQRAASGDAVEIDHIVPRSRGGDNGLNNKVLCYVEANRRKANKTPRESLDGAAWEALEKRMKHLRIDSPPEQDYFTKKDYRRKWENLTRDPKPDEFRASQLTDTAYAAKQVGEYLRSSLYPDKPHRVVFTKGSYTDVLRRDWRLFQRLPEPWPQNHEPTEEERKKRWDALKKDRDDHRHHAIDAVVIALTVNQHDPQNDYLAQLKHELEAMEEEKEKRKEEGSQLSADWPRRKPLLPPWPTVHNQASAAERNRAWQAFRLDVLSKVYGEFDAMYARAKAEQKETGKPLIVSHRPQRHLYGALHEDTPYGKAKEYPGLYVTRKYITQLQASHFVEPEQKSDRTWKIPGKGQGQAIRDPALRRELSECLMRGEVRVEAKDFQQKSQLKSLVNCNCLDPAPDLEQSWDDLKEWLDDQRPKLLVDVRREWRSDPQKRAFETAVKIINRHDGFRMKSGMPIRSMRLLLALADPVLVKKNGVERFYKGGNNHHLEILKDDNTGEWTGCWWNMFYVARRVRPPRGLPHLPMVIGRDLERLRENGQLSDALRQLYRDEDLPRMYEGKSFVMSLGIGEIIFMKSPVMKYTTVEPEDYFVVVELHSQKIFLAHHSDARPKSGKNPVTGEKLKPPAQRETKKISPNLLLERHKLSNGQPPYKVQVSPLGKITPLAND